MRVARTVAACDCAMHEKGLIDVPDGVHLRELLAGAVVAESSSSRADVTSRAIPSHSSHWSLTGVESSSTLSRLNEILEAGLSATRAASRSTAPDLKIIRSVSTLMWLISGMRSTWDKTHSP